MSNLEKVMEELYPGYSTRKSEKVKVKVEHMKTEEEPKMEEKKEEVSPVKREVEQIKRRRRVMKPRKPAEPKQEGLLSNNMYTMAIVGTIGMEGYPLNPGEKLVIAKLTPIPITK